MPIKPGLISGVTQVCAYVGQQVTVTYTIDPIAGAQSYTWVTPANTSIVSGQGTTSIELLYSQAFVSGNIGVRSNASCGSSSYRTLSVTKQVTRPGPITASSSPCPNSTVTYSIDSPRFPTPLHAPWTLPMNAVYVSGQGSTSYTVTFKPEFTTGTVGVKSLNNCSSSLSTTLALDAASCAPAQIQRYRSDLSTMLKPGLYSMYSASKQRLIYRNHTFGLLLPAKIQLLIHGRVVFEQTGANRQTGTFQSVICAEKLFAGIYELKSIRWQGLQSASHYFKINYNIMNETVSAS
ncbi:MAG: hypothetical protein U0T56_02255 [Ferruginibacter sp.]